MSARFARRQLYESALHLLRLITQGKAVPVMAILDTLAAAITAAEATDAAATAKITALAAENATLKQQVTDLTAETAAAQALADKLTAANTPLQAAVTAAA